jgi:hypothetical protein
MSDRQYPEIANHGPILTRTQLWVNVPREASNMNRPHGLNRLARIVRCIAGRGLFLAHATAYLWVRTVVLTAVSAADPASGPTYRSLIYTIPGIELRNVLVSA